MQLVGIYCVSHVLVLNPDFTTLFLSILESHNVRRSGAFWLLQHVLQRNRVKGNWWALCLSDATWDAWADRVIHLIFAAATSWANHFRCEVLMYFWEITALVGLPSFLLLLFTAHWELDQVFSTWFIYDYFLGTHWTWHVDICTLWR